MKKQFLIIALLFTLPLTSFAAIAFDNAIGGNGASATSLTYSKTNTGANLMLIVGVQTEGADDITGVTYNSVSMVQETKHITGGSANTYLYALFNPATGAHNVVVSFTGSHITLRSVAMSYTGVLQSNTLDSVGSIGNLNTTGTTLSATTTTIANNSWMVDFFGVQRSQTATTGTKRSDSGGDGSFVGNDATDIDPITPAGLGTINSAYGSSIAINGVNAVYASFAPFVATVPTINSDLITLEDQ